MSVRIGRTGLRPNILTATTPIGGLGSGTNKWLSGVLAPNGKIYGIPAASTSVLVIDPNNLSRYVEIRGDVVEITQDGAINHANKQTRAYTNGKKQQFYGDVYPVETKEKETRVIFKILPTKVNVNAIFS